MSVTLRAGDSINLTTGVVTRQDTQPMIDFHRARLAENQLPALLWFLRRQSTTGAQR